MGLREVKKEQTRRLIADAASRLFFERGFDKVTVAEIAGEAQVAVATVFNYFATKEDLFYSGLDAFGADLVEAVRSRPPGASALAAFRDHLLQSNGHLAELETGGSEALERLRAVSRLIESSPALRTREQNVLARIARSLSTLLADDTGAAVDDVTADVVANALVGVHRALIDHVRRRVLADGPPTGLAAEVDAVTVRAFAVLERGLGDYAAKP